MGINHRRDKSEAWAQRWHGLRCVRIVAKAMAAATIVMHARMLMGFAQTAAIHCGMEIAREDQHRHDGNKNSGEQESHLCFRGGHSTAAVSATPNGFGRRGFRGTRDGKV